MSRTVLVVSPHSDDSDFGMGGTIAKHINDGDTVIVALLATHSNDDVRVSEFLSALESYPVVPVLSWRQKFIDGRIGDNEPKLIEFIDGLKNEYKPSIAYIPYPSNHQDHQAAYNGSLRSLRASLNSSQHFVKEIYAYSVAQSTDNGFHPHLSPVKFKTFGIEELNMKLAAIRCHQSQLSDAPSTNSEEFVLSEARTNGAYCFAEYAEVFCPIRVVS